MTRPTPWAMLPTLVVTWLAFGQVLSLSGLAIWVIAGSVSTAWLVHTLFTNHRPVLAVLAAVALTGVVPVLARSFGGDTAGPITRSALMSTGVAAAMALILCTRYRIAVVAAGLILLGGATGLGAAGRAPWLVGLWAVGAAATFLLLGPYRRVDLRDRHRLARTAVTLMVVGLLAVAGIGAATPVLRTPWTIPGAASINDPTADDSAPPPSTGDTDTSPTDTSPTDTSPTETSPTDTGQPEPDPAEHETQDATVPFVAAVLLVALALLLLLVVPVVRRVAVALRWRWVRAALQRGTARERIVGAWTWVRLCRARYGGALPLAASPDVAVRIADRERDDALRELSALVSEVSYDPRSQPSPEIADRAWAAARLAGSRPDGTTMRERWRWSRIGPRAARKALHAPTVEERSDPRVAVGR